jgi:hypothetical protein
MLTEPGLNIMLADTEIDMKAVYSKPVFAKRERLSQVVAAAASPPPSGNAS